jgi:hypothetical protein
VLVGIQVFSTPGTTTYTPSAGATNAQVIVTAAGGGGGGAAGVAADTASEVAAGGGGAGGTSIALIDLTSTSSVQVVVGSGGTAGTNTGADGGIGGYSKFSTFASATGGGAGDGLASGTAGISGNDVAGGAGSAGDLNLSGGNGAAGVAATEGATGGVGGASYWGGGGSGGWVGTTAGADPGASGGAYGSGGGGGATSDDQTTPWAAGGAGANGVVVVYEYGPFNGIMSIANGGTGIAYSPTYGQLLMGDGAGGYTLVATSTLGIGGSSFATSSVDYYLQSSSTVPKTYTANTFTALQTITNASTTNITALYASSTQGFFGSLSLGSLSGILKATAGAVSNALVSLTSDVTGILGVSNGGTGTSTAPTYGKLLVGNALGGYDLIATSSLGISSGGGTWGSITGTLSAQTDLQSALDAKLALSSWYATTTDGLAQGATNKYYSSLLFAGDLAGTTTDALAEGSSRLYFTNGRVQTYLDTISKGYFFATSSANFWKTQNNFFATTSADHWLTQKTTDDLAQGSTNKYYSSLLFAGDLAATTTDALAEGSTNKYFSNTLVGAYISGSSTIPHIGGTAFGDMLSWTGSAWATRATSTLGVAISDTVGTLGESRGGTNQTTYTKGDILYASDDNVLARLPIGSNGEVLKVTGAGIPQWGMDLTSGGGGGGSGYFSTTTNSLAIFPSVPSYVVMVGNTSTSTDDSIFEVSGRSYFSNRIGVATTSPGSIFSVNDVANFAAGGSTFYSSITAPAFTASNATTTNATSTNLAVTGTASTSNLVASNSFTFKNVTGFLKATAGAVATALVDLTSDVTGILSIANGGTGTSTAPTYGKVLVGNSVGGYDLVATSSLGITAGGASAWGSITGTLSAQTDLQSALDAKLALSSWYATTTDGLAEGSTNKYFSNALVGAYISGSSTIPHIGGTAFGDMLSWTGSAWATRATSTLALKTVDLVEESNLFWTNNRFDNRLSATTTLPSLTTLANLATVGTITSGTFSSAISGATINGTPIGATVASTAVFTNATTTNATSTNLAVTGTTQLGSLAVSGNTTLAQATSTTMAVTSISNGLVAANGSGSLITASIGSSLSFSGNTLSLNLSNPNLWTGLQTFGNASTTAMSALDYVTVGRTATTTIRGEANATSTFAGGVQASALNVTGSATSTYANGINIANGCFSVNGTCITPGGTYIVLSKITQIAASTTWTEPADLSHVVVEVWGAGGGGGGGDSSATSVQTGGGGGGGGYALKKIRANELAGTVTVDIGAGGAAGNATGGNGGGGGGSGFRGHASAEGGGGGTGSGSANATVSSSPGGTGGAATTGDVNLAGGNGASGIDGATSDASNRGGEGGNSPRGGQGGPFTTVDGNTDMTGIVGSAPGGGGSGGADNDTTGSVGGAGGAGMVIVYEYTSTSTITGADLAENYPVAEPTIGAGDIVSFDEGLPISIKRATVGDNRPLAGIVSTRPGIVLGAGAELGQRPVALSGRVPVKFSYENGDVQIGDRITISSQPGVGKKAGPFDDSVGIVIDAVQRGEEGDTVMVFMDLRPGVPINKIAFGLLGNQGTFFGLDASTTADSISGPIDFVGAMMNAIAARMSGFAATTTATASTSPLTNATSSGDVFSGIALYNIMKNLGATSGTSSQLAALSIALSRATIDSLEVDAIEPIEKDVQIKIGEDGKFIIAKAGEEDLSVSFDGPSTAEPAFAVSIDALGNALFAGALTAANFEVGSAEHPGGITMYDTATGEPYCTQIAGGKLKTVAGKCGEENAPLSSGDSSDVSGGGASALESSSPPIIIIQGNNPAYIDIGATYADLGASVTDDHDNNLGIHTYIDGVEVSEVVLDTSAPATHTIHYRVTDTDGNISEEHRVVVVGESEAAEEVVESSEEAAPAEVSTPETTPQAEAPGAQEEQTPAPDPVPPPVVASEPEAPTVSAEATPVEPTPLSETETL